MQKIETSKLPTISGANVRPVRAVSNLENLKVSGIAFATYSPRKGDVIEFPDTFADVQAFEQPIRRNNPEGPVQVLLAVMRNGKADYLSMGSLRKQDVEGNFTCPFTKEMGELNNDYDRIEHLLGKKIKVVDTKAIKVQKFDRLSGERIEGETVNQTVPVIEYA